LVINQSSTVTERSRSDTSTPLGVRVNLNNNRQPD